MTAIQDLKRANIPRALTEVPPFPIVAIKALQVISSEHSQLRELSDLITTDAAFSGDILRMANSALLGGRIEVSSILQAIHLLGLERLKGVVVTMAMKSYLGDSLEVPALRACWRHSLACAVIAEKLARLSLMEAEVAYTAGLMHDVGRLALVAGYPGQYANFLASIEKEPCDDALQRERDLFGIDHCRAGVLVVARWNLPKMFISVTSRHHNPAVAGEPAVLSTVRHACMMAEALGFNVVHALHPRSYEEILGDLPERARSQLPREPSDSPPASQVKSI